MIFIALIEVRPLPGSILDPQAAGAAVRCYIPADSEPQAIARLRDSLARDRLELAEVEFCAPMDGKWAQPDDGTDAEGASRAIKSGIVEYGDFHCWGHDAPDA